ncbi:MAG: DUF1214 domain-containing protein, partial [Cellvibrionaceae bacterium]|nr:DUF1214 domain-containing protein [Cellvibrionaceae bacterium]
GQAPAGLKLLRMKENIFLAAVRYGVLQGEAGELEAVKKLQQQVLTTSLSNWPQHKGKVKPLQNPRPLKSYQGELAFFEKMADLLAESPPAPAHAAALAPFKTIGIEVGKPFVASKLDEATRKGLARAIKDSQDIMRWKVKYRGTPYDSRWNNLHPGSYGFNYINRAEGALEGLIVHDREEAVYFSTYEDGSGALLDAKKQYVLHFDKDEIPQIEGNGFWSLTMYGPDFQLVSNPIDRFSIGDRTPGLQYNEDGSLTVYIQRQPPEGKESNWLPTPEAGLFRVNYRIYRPSEAASNPKTLRKFIPAIKKLN